jgi:hypothetical protein
MSVYRIPNEEVASGVVEAMTNEKVLSSIRMTTGDQYFVFAIKTANSDYVIRMTKVIGFCVLLVKVKSYVKFLFQMSY